MKRNIIIFVVYCLLAVALMPYQSTWSIWALIAVMLIGLILVNTLSHRVEPESLQENVEIEAGEKKEKWELKKILSQNAFTQLSSNPEADWDNILESLYVYNGEILKMDEILIKVVRCPLNGLLTISQIKCLLVWDERLINALNLIERISVSSYNDEILKELIKNFNSFREHAKKHQSYHGYARLAETIRENMPRTLVLADR